MQKWLQTLSHHHNLESVFGKTTGILLLCFASCNKHTFSFKGLHFHAVQREEASSLKGSMTGECREPDVATDK